MGSSPGGWLPELTEDPKFQEKEEFVDKFMQETFLCKVKKQRKKIALIT